MPEILNLPRCELTDFVRVICAHCRAAGYQPGELEQEWLAAQPSTHHVIPQHVRRLAEYPKQARWAGVDDPSDRPAGVINCDGDGHAHPDRFICDACAGELERHLADVPGLVEDLHVTLVKLDRFPERGQLGAQQADRDEAPINFKPAARLAMSQLVRAMRYPSETDEVVAHVRPYEFVRRAAHWMLATFEDQLRNPDLNAVAGAISRACVHARRVIDRSRDVFYYGVCPQCSTDIYQERVDVDDRDARVTCSRCGYSASYREHELNCLDAGDDRWLTISELVGAIQSAGEIVTRRQIQQWIAHDGLAKDQRLVPAWDGGPGYVFDVYRLGDVRERARIAEEERHSITSAEVAVQLGVSHAYVKVLVQRGKLTPLRPGAKPLRFTREQIDSYRADR
jgi:excisionase family DNA binding protein